MKRIISLWYTLFFAVVIITAAVPEPPTRFEFVDQDIGDILSALSAWRGISIVGDDTVKGRTSFRYTGAEFEKAFESFLQIEQLYLIKTETIWTVSRIQVQLNSDGFLSIKTSNAPLSAILQRISFTSKVPVLYDILPVSCISFQSDNCTALTAVSSLLLPFPQWQVQETGGSILIRSAELSADGSGHSGYNAPGPGQPAQLTVKDGLYNAVIQRGRLSEVLTQFFTLSGKNYSNLAGADNPVSELSFSGADFTTALKLILEQAGADFVEDGAMWYILPLNQRETLNRVRNGRSNWLLYRLEHTRLSEAIAVVQRRFPEIQCIPVEQSGVMLVSLGEKEQSEFENLLKLTDCVEEKELITLKYIRTADLLKNLPPGIALSDISETGTGNSFFFRGTQARREQFRKDLNALDIPPARIRYDMLIIQFEDSSSISLNTRVEIRPVQAGDITAFTGSLNGLLGIKFDVLSVFGHQFSAQLHAAMRENRAAIHADTTLYGISGEQIKFQNTSTYRYRDPTFDSETGKASYTGITREIVSGVVVQILGWSSGDGMITMDVEASISKRGADVSSQTGNPPPTSEKLISTRIRSRSGRPVVLSGLNYSDAGVSEQRTPFISRIPLIGLLFRNTAKTEEHSEMIIYLVPHLDCSGDNIETRAAQLDSAIERIVFGYVK